MSPGETGALQTDTGGRGRRPARCSPGGPGARSQGSVTPALPLLDVVPAHRAHRGWGRGRLRRWRPPAPTPPPPRRTLGEANEQQRRSQGAKQDA